MMFIDVNVWISPKSFFLLFVQKMSEVKCESYDCIKVMCIFIRFTSESLHMAASKSLLQTLKLIFFSCFQVQNIIPNKKAAKITYQVSAAYFEYFTSVFIKHKSKNTFFV